MKGLALDVPSDGLVAGGDGDGIDSGGVDTYRQVFAQTHHLCKLAAEAGKDCEAFWLRGIPKAEWLETPPPPPNDVSRLLSPIGFSQSRKFFVDGSGGKNSSCDITRRCGFAAVAVDMETSGFDIVRIHVDYCVFGPLPGSRQTVPRAELYAALRVFSLVPCDHDLEIVSDCSYVVEGFLLGLEGTKGYSNRDLWKQLFHLLDSKGLTVCFTKIKSHLLDKHREVLIANPSLFSNAVGNSVADVLAERGAEAHEVPANRCQEISWLAARCRLISLRIAGAFRLHLHAAAKRPKKITKDRAAPPASSGGGSAKTWDRKWYQFFELDSLGHDIQINNGRVGCVACGMTFTWTNLEKSTSLAIALAASFANLTTMSG